MSRQAGSDGPEDVDATFEEIVADLRASGFGEDGAAEDAKRQPEPEPEEPGPDPEPPAAAASAGWRTGGSGWDETVLGDDPSADDEHYVPPEPPPLPKPRKGAALVLLFFVVGLLLLIAPGVIGMSSSMGTPFGMFALAIGIGLLLLRVRQGPPDGSDPSNGAQV